MKTPLGFATWLTVLLAGCAVHPTDEPYSGPLAKPQVAYRIDKHRFFEVVPLENFACACARARLYYTDTAKRIHVNVASWDKVSDGTFIIDAANDQYLVAPIIVSSSGCQTGGGYLCSNRLYYSQNGGRSWKVTRSNIGTSTLLTGSMLYVPIRHHGGWKVNIVTGIADDQRWEEYGSSVVEPKPLKAPVDTKFHCNSEDKE